MDVDGDGVTELLGVCARPDASTTVQTLLISLDDNVVLTELDWSVGASLIGNNIGRSLVVLEDYDGNGFNEVLLVGPGSLYVLFIANEGSNLRVDLVFPLGSKASADYSLWSSVSSFSVAQPAGDLDGNSLSDVLLSVPDVSGQLGEVFVVYLKLVSSELPFYVTEENIPKLNLQAQFSKVAGKASAGSEEPADVYSPAARYATIFGIRNENGARLPVNYESGRWIFRNVCRRAWHELLHRKLCWRRGSHHGASGNRF